MSDVYYKTVNQITSVLLFVQGIKNAAYNEIASITLEDGREITGQVLDSRNGLAIVQSFGETRGVNLENTKVKFSGETAKLAVSTDMLGRIFDGVGRPRDGGEPIYSDERIDITGSAINPASREEPSEFIQTGISTIDGMNTLVRGQKLPIFSGSGLPHNRIAAQIARQAKLIGGGSEKFSVVFGGIGINSEEVNFFKREFEETGALDRSVMFLNLSSEPSMERVILPRLVLTTAEYLAYKEDMHVLVILTDMTNYCFHADTEVIFGDGEIEEIGDFVESSLSNVDGTSEEMALAGSKRTIQVLKLKKQQLQSSRQKALSWDGARTKISPISAIQKINAPDKFIYLKTRSGAELRVTADHKILVDTPIGPSLVEAAQLKAGDRIYSVREIEFESPDRNVLDLLLGCDDELFLHMNDQEIENMLVAEYGSLSAACNELGINYNRISDAFDKRSYSLKDIAKVASALKMQTAELAKKIDYITAGGKERIQFASYGITPAYARLLGMISSDGTIYKSPETGAYYISFCNKRKELVEQFIDQAEKLFAGINVQLHQNQDGVWIARINSLVLVDVFERLLAPNSKKELLPIFRMSKAHIGEFLAGYLDGDGSVQKKRIVYTTKHKMRANRLQLLLKRLGIASTRLRRVSDGSFGKSGVFDIAVQGGEDLLRFASSINPWHQRKKVMLESFFNKPLKEGAFHIAPASCAREFVALRKKYGIKAIDLGASSTISQFESHERNVGRSIVKGWLEKLAHHADGDENFIALKRLVEGNYILDEIKVAETVPNLDQKFVYDFTVEETHRIVVGNGIITSNCEALREISAAREEVPGRRGYPGYMYTDLSTIYERAGKIKGRKGSITQLPILTMPGDDITHPIPDLTGYITEGQIVLSRDLQRRGVYPNVDVLLSLSRLMNQGIGKQRTREDHRGVADQLFSAYARGKEVRSLIEIVGEEALSASDRKYLHFADDFESKFVNQDYFEDRDIDRTLELGWELFSGLDKTDIKRVKDEYIAKYGKWDGTK